MKTTRIRLLIAALGAMLIALLCTSAAEASCTPGSTCNLSGGTPPTIVPAAGGTYAAMSSGLFTYSHTDLALPAPMPIAITRTYRSEARNTSGSFIASDFGLGTTLNYSIFLYSFSEVAAGTYNDAELVMPDGSEIKCQNPILNQTDYTQATFVCKYQPIGIWFGATLKWNATTLQWDLTRKDGTVYSFGKGVPLQRIADRYNNAVTVSRNVSSLSGCTNPGTRIESFIAGVSTSRYVNVCHDSSQDPTLITKLFDNSGRIVNFTYQYNPSQLVTVTYTSYNSAAQTSYYYSGVNPGVGDIDAVTVQVTAPVGSNQYLVDINYDSSKRLQQIYQITSINPFTTSGPTYAYTTDGNGHITQCTVTLPTGANIPGSGSKRVLTFDTNGYLTGDARASGSSISETSTFTRDAITELITSTTDSLGRVTNLVYDNNNNNITLANLTSVTVAAGTSQASTTSLVWNVSTNPTFDEVSSMTDPLNHTWTAGIDSLTGNMTSVTSPAPVSTTSTATYKPTGQIATWKDSVNPATQFNYASGTGDLASVTDSLGNTTSFVTDSVGRVTSVTTPIREKVSYQYDAMNHVTSAIDANGRTTTFTYDVAGHLTKLTDALTNATTWNWTPPSGTLWDVKECDPASHCVETNLDWLSGLPIWVIDKRNIKNTPTYDALQRVTNLAFNSNGVSGFSKTNIGYTYDGADRVTNMVDTGGGSPSNSGNTQIIGYDLLDNVTSESAPEGSVTHQYNWTLPKTLQVPNQTIVNYTFDPANRLTNVAQGSLAANRTYDAADRLTCLTLPNNVIVTYGYDSGSRVTSLTYGTGGSCTSPPNNLGTLTYIYDADNRIVGNGGNLAAVNLPPALSSATYRTTNQVATWSGVSSTIDAANNLKTDPSNGSVPYGWNERNQLSSASNPNYLFYYDAFGRRETFNNFGIIMSYLYDTLMAVQENSSNTSAVPNQNYLTTPNGEVLAYSATASSTTTSVPLHDVMGSTIGLVNSSGNLATNFTYEPFGAVMTSGQSSSYSYLFAGMEYDSATTLYHTYARYYSPRLQRFLSEDPLGFGGGDANLFAYVWNSPSNFVDPLGLWGFGVTGGANVEAGTGSGGSGAAVNGSVGGGLFFNGATPNDAGTFASGGAFVNTPVSSGSFPAPIDGNDAAGAYEGGGIGVFFSPNATSVADLSGPFQTTSWNAGYWTRVVSVQKSVGKNAKGERIVVWNIGIPIVPVGAGFGLGRSHYSTCTAILSEAKVPLSQAPSPPQPACSGSKPKVGPQGSSASGVDLSGVFFSINDGIITAETGVFGSGAVAAGGFTF